MSAADPPPDAERTPSARNVPAAGLTAGEKLQAALDAHSMTRVKLAAYLGLPTESVNALIAGREPFTEGISVQLAQLFSLSVRYWQP